MKPTAEHEQTARTIAGNFVTDWSTIANGSFIADIDKLKQNIANALAEAADKEREACAKLLDRFIDPIKLSEKCPNLVNPMFFSGACKEIAAAIRSRKEKT